MRNTLFTVLLAIIFLASLTVGPYEGWQARTWWDARPAKALPSYALRVAWWSRTWAFPMSLKAQRDATVLAGVPLRAGLAQCNASIDRLIAEGARRTKAAQKAVDAAQQGVRAAENIQRHLMSSPVDTRTCASTLAGVQDILAGRDDK